MTDVVTTTILDLNDDCLREIFEHLDPYDLVAIVDVCRRFRHASTEDHFVRRKFGFFAFESHVLSPQKLKRLPNLLRHYSRFIKLIELKGLEGSHELIKLFSSYCSQIPTKLIISRENPVEIAVQLCMFRNIQRLDLVHLRPFDQSILKMVPDWCPNLQKLRLLLIDTPFEPFDGLHRHFPKLKRISLRYCHTIVDDDIEQFLERNPQLVNVGIYECCKLSKRSLESIVKYLPQVESVWIEPIPGSPSIDLNIQIVPGQLANLKSLRLSSVNLPASTIEKIAAIEHFCLDGCNENNNIDSLVEKICRLTKLKSLNLQFVANLNAAHMHMIGKYLLELTHLNLHATGLMLTT